MIYDLIWEGITTLEITFLEGDAVQVVLFTSSAPELLKLLVSWMYFVVHHHKSQNIYFDFIVHKPINSTFGSIYPIKSVFSKNVFRAFADLKGFVLDKMTFETNGMT
jgi:hypothetical protein